MSIVAASAGPASAADAGLLNGLSLEDVSDVLGDGGYALESKPTGDGGIVVKCERSTGAIFYLLMSACEDARCGVADAYVFFRPDGISLSRLSEVESSSLNSGGAYRTYDRGVMRRRIYLREGATRENFAYQLGAFLGEASTALRRLKPGGVERVSFRADAPGATDGPMSSVEAAFHVGARELNAVGVNAPAFSLDGVAD
ncbi:MAG: hypothetical protein GC152_00185 [Alphaproteobacteria bacterium]|nr:hypothetical protein [Alphaproteobacteria bacterium]